MVVPSFAAESDREVVLAECQLSYDEYDESFYLLYSSLSLNVGDTYIVVYNGAEFSCVAQDLSNVQSGVYGLGDCSIWAEQDASLFGNGEPFAIVFVSGDLMLLPFDGSTEVTLAIYKSSSGESSDVVTDPFITSFSFSFADIGDSATNYDGFLVGLVSGQMYEVIYNGTSYICEAKTGDYLGYPYVYVGNPKKAFNGVFPADGDLPFGYVEIDTGTKMTFVGGSGATSGVVYDFSFYHYIKPADEALRDDITSVVSSSTGWAGSFLEAITESPLLLLFVLTSFVSLGISIISLVKRK